MILFAALSAYFLNLLLPSNRWMHALRPKPDRPSRYQHPGMTRTVSWLAVFAMCGIFVTCALFFVGLRITPVYVPLVPSLNVQHTARADAYCPWCANDGLCKRKFLFLLATPTSGVNTVERMLDGIPGVVLSADNYNEPSHLCRMFAARMLLAANSTQGFSSAFRQRELLAIQDWIWKTNAHGAKRLSETIVGFKETRWTQDDVSFIQAVCPCSRFVVNTRRQDDLDSNLDVYANQNGENGDNANERIDRVAKGISPDRVFRIHLEEFSVEKFNALVSWLGFDCHFDRLRISSTRAAYRSGLSAQCVFSRARRM
jgi:hypothetical protein